MSKTNEITPGSGNVFADIGVADPDEALLKARFAATISRHIQERGLTQTEAARILGVDQPKVSALMRGRLSGFSLERLLRFARALDYEVEIRLRSARARQEPAETIAGR
jgi:predicted XRE-type DNA-binding protein